MPTGHERFAGYLLRARLPSHPPSESFVAEGPGGVPCVVERLRSHLRSEDVARRAFEAELEARAELRGPFLPPVLGLGVDDGVPWIALGHVTGSRLSRLLRYLRRHGHALSPGTAALVGADLARAAADLRGQGVTGALGLAPGDVLADHDGVLWLARLGTAAAHLAQDHPRLLGAASGGALTVPSPELLARAPMGPATDVWRAACVTVELLLGERPFPGSDRVAISAAVRAGASPALEARADGLPPALVDVLRRGLRAEPEARPALAELVSVLHTVMGGDAPGLRVELGELVSRVVAEEQVDPTRPRLGPVPALEYDVRPAGESAPEAYTYARLVRAIATGSIDGRASVRAGQGPYVDVESVPELRRHLPSVPPPPQGRPRPLTDGRFVGLLGELALARATGLVICEQGAVRKRVWLRGGQPVHVSSNVAAELLGESLVARGALSRGELDMALAVMPRYAGRLGDTVVGLGLLPAGQLLDLLALQVRERLLDPCLWETGRATFHPDAPEPETHAPLTLDAWDLLDEAVGRRVAQGLEGARLGLARVEPTEGATRRLAQAGAPSRLADRVSRAGGGRSARDVAGGTPPGEREVALLLHVGLLAPV